MFYSGDFFLFKVEAPSFILGMIFVIISIGMYYRLSNYSVLNEEINFELYILQIIIALVMFVIGMLWVLEIVFLSVGISIIIFLAAIIFVLHYFTLRLPPEKFILDKNKIVISGDKEDRKILLEDIYSFIKFKSMVFICLTELEDNNIFLGITQNQRFLRMNHPHSVKNFLAFKDEILEKNFEEKFTREQKDMMTGTNLEKKIVRISVKEGKYPRSAFRGE